MIKLEFRILPDGNLEITCDDPDKEELQDILDSTTHKDHGFLADMLEYTGWQPNGQLFKVQPEWIGALTDAPILTDNLLFPDKGDPTITPESKVWWFPNYMIESFAETLILDGRVVFTKAPQNDEQESAK